MIRFNFDFLKPELERKVRRVLRDHQDALVEAMQQRAPYDTGLLRSSITKAGIRSNADVVSMGIESKVHYGSYQEFGTKRMKAQPHIRPAIDADLDDLIIDIVEAIGVPFDAMEIDIGEVVIEDDEK